MDHSREMLSLRAARILVETLGLEYLHRDWVVDKELSKLYARHKGPLPLSMPHPLSVPASRLLLAESMLYLELLRLSILLFIEGLHTLASFRWK